MNGGLYERQSQHDKASALLQVSQPVSEDTLKCTSAVETTQKEIAAAEMPMEPHGSVKYHEKLVVDLDAEEMSILKDAFAKAQKESGLRDRPSLLIHMAKAFLEEFTPSGARRKPRYQIVIHRHLPSGLTWCNTPKGERPVSSEVLREALCDAETVELDETGPPTWEQDEEKETCSGDMKDDASSKNSDIQNEVIDHVNEQYMRMKSAKRHGHKSINDNKDQLKKESRGIPEALRKKVLLRDGCTCQAPGCGRKTFLLLSGASLTAPL